MPITRSGVLVALAMLIATPVAWSYTYRPLNLAAVTAASALLALICLGWRRLAGGSAGRATLVLAGLLTAFAVWRWRPSPNVTITGWFWPSVLLSGIAAVVVVAALLLRRVSGQVAAAALLVALLVGALGTVLAVPGGARPEIDVWVLLQDAARGVLGGQNPYAMAFPDVPAGQTSTCFTYLPGSFLLVTPGRVLGDVRVALAAAFVIPWLVLAARSFRQMWRRPVAESVIAVAPVVVALVLPATLRMLQQSWTDSLLVGLVVVAVMCWRSTWVVLPLGLALATKQHALLMLPLLPLWLGWRRSLGAVGVAAAVGVPYFLADPGRFLTCTVSFFLDLPMTGTSISLWTVLPDALRSPLLVVVFLVLAYVIAWRALPRGRSTFPLAFAVALCAFNLTNKQSYVNQWWLVAELLLLSAVSIGADLGPGAEPPGGNRRRSAGRSGRLRRVPSTASAPAGTTSRVSRRGVLGAAAGTLALAGCTDPSTPSPTAGPTVPTIPAIGGNQPATPAAGPDRALLAQADSRLTDLLRQFPAKPAKTLRGDLVRLRGAVGRQRKAFAGLARSAAPGNAPGAAGSSGSSTTQAIRLAAHLSSVADDLTEMAGKATAGDTAALLSSAAAGLTAARWAISPSASKRPGAAP